MHAQVRTRNHIPSVHQHTCARTMVHARRIPCSQNVLLTLQFSALPIKESTTYPLEMLDKRRRVHLKDIACNDDHVVLDVTKQTWLVHATWPLC